MTNKEAIELLKPLREYREVNGIANFPMICSPAQAEAIQYAIMKLEEEHDKLNRVLHEAYDMGYIDGQTDSIHRFGKLMGG